MTSRPRRLVLALGGVFAAAALLRLRPWQRWFPTELTFAEIDGLPGFRRLLRDDTRMSLGQGGPAAGLLIGLEPPPGDRPDPARVAAILADPCTALFADPRDASAVPIAYFTDIRCPVCRELEGHLSALEAEFGPAIDIRTHEYPVFGAPSRRAARALVAAGDRAPDLRPRLQRTPAVIEDRVISAIAADLGIDAEALLAGMAAPAVARQLADSAALAQAFGIYGTPGLVIGRTLVVGGADATLLRHIIALEQANGPICR